MHPPSYIIRDKNLNSRISVKEVSCHIPVWVNVTAARNALSQHVARILGTDEYGLLSRLVL